MNLPKVAFATALLFASVAARVAAGAVDHEPLLCLPMDTSARVSASVGREASVSSARVYFRPEGAASDYFLEMRRSSGSNWVAFFPVVASSETAVLYRIEVRDGEGRMQATPAVRVKASPGCQALMTDDERRMAKNLVLGLTVAGQPVVPVGFSSAGIVARITPSGDLQTVLPGAVPAAEAPVASSTSRTGPAATCAGCGTLTIGGTSGIGVGPNVIPTPPPVSSVRPPSGRN